MTDVLLAPGRVRVFAHCGVGSLLAGRWNDVSERHPSLAGWIDAGLVSRTGPRGEPPPERLAQPCCGGR